MRWLQNVFASCRNEEEKAARVQQIFASTFSGETGEACLTMILEDLQYFSKAETPAQVALRNYANQLLGRIGVVDHAEMVHKLLQTRGEK